MENLDAKTLTHIGVEVVVIAGLAIYYQKKTSDLDARLKTLEQIIKEQENVIKSHQQFLTQIAPIIQHFGSNQANPLPRHPAPKSRRVNKHPAPRGREKRVPEHEEEYVDEPEEENREPEEDDYVDEEEREIVEQELRETEDASKKKTRR